MTTSTTVSDVSELIDKLLEAEIVLTANDYTSKAKAVREAIERLQRERPGPGVVAVDTLHWFGGDRVPEQTHRRVLLAIDGPEEGPKVVPGYYDASAGVFRPPGSRDGIIAAVLGWAFMPSFPEADWPSNFKLAV